MARTQAQLYALIKRSAPGWFWAEIDDADAHAWGWAKILERFEQDQDAYIAGTMIGDATGKDLGLHLIDHGLVKATGETEPHQRTRIAAQMTVRAVTKPGILALLSDILTGTIVIRSHCRDSVFYSRSRFLNRDYHIWADKPFDGAFTVYCEPQADPNTYISAWQAIDAARGACIPARLEVMS